MIDRLFYAAVLVACAAATVLTLAEPARIAANAAPSTSVVQLERVVITASREDGRTVATVAASEPAGRTVR
jgi:hypothetical protein